MRNKRNSHGRKKIKEFVRRGREKTLVMPAPKRASGAPVWAVRPALLKNGFQNLFCRAHLHFWASFPSKSLSKCLLGAAGLCISEKMQFSNFATHFCFWQPRWAPSSHPSSAVKLQNLYLPTTTPTSIRPSACTGPDKEASIGGRIGLGVAKFLNASYFACANLTLKMFGISCNLRAVPKREAADKTWSIFALLKADSINTSIYNRLLSLNRYCTF